MSTSIQGSAGTGATGTGAAGAQAHAAVCANCGQSLLGPYCHGCGQVGHVHHSLLHLSEELLHGVLHFDAKALRTLPLLVLHPGRLTRRYLDGQRVRYLNPLTLFLFSIFLLLFVVSLGPATPSVSAVNAQQRNDTVTALTAQVKESDAEVADATAALSQARARGSGVAQAQSTLEDARTEQRVATAALHTVQRVLPQTAASGQGATVTFDLWALLPANFSRTHPRLFSALQAIRKDPALYLYRLREAGSHFAFLLIPISLPFLSLLFIRRRDVSAYDHAIFSLYSLSFMSLLVVAVTLLGAAHLSGTAAAAMLIVPPVHMFAQLKGTYRLDVPAALWCTAALLVVAGTVFLVFLLLLVIIALR